MADMENFYDDLIIINLYLLSYLDNLIFLAILFNFRSGKLNKNIK